MGLCVLQLSMFNIPINSWGRFESGVLVRNSPYCFSWKTLVNFEHGISGFKADNHITMDFAPFPFRPGTQLVWKHGIASCMSASDFLPVSFNVQLQVPCNERRNKWNAECLGKTKLPVPPRSSFAACGGALAALPQPTPLLLISHQFHADRSLSIQALDHTIYCTSVP